MTFYVHYFTRKNKPPTWLHFPSESRALRSHNSVISKKDTVRSVVRYWNADGNYGGEIEAWNCPAPHYFVLYSRHEGRLQYLRFEQKQPALSALYACYDDDAYVTEYDGEGRFLEKTEK